MAYPVQTLADGRIKMSDGTIVANNTKKNIPGVSATKPKLNLFDFSTPVNKSVGPVAPTPAIKYPILPTTNVAYKFTAGLQKPAPQVIQPKKESGFSLIPKASASEGIKNNNIKLFKDEQEAFNKMKSDGLDDETAKKLISKRRSDLFGKDSKLTPLEGAAVQKMISDGLNTNDAVNLIKQYRQKPKQDTRPLWKKAGEGAINLAAGNLESILKYGGNILDIATFGKAGFGEDVDKMKEQNKELFKDSKAFKVGQVLPGAAATTAIAGATAGLGLIPSATISGGATSGLGEMAEKGSKTSFGEVAKETGIGGLTGLASAGILKGVGKGASFIQKSLPTKLQLSGLLSPSKVDTAKNAIISEGEKAPENVAKWMLDRGIKGTKQNIVEQLNKRALTSKETLDKGLSSIKDKFVSKEANIALKELYDDVSKYSGLQDEAKAIKGLMNKKGHSLSELNDVKRRLDDVYNIYKNSGEVSAGLKAKSLDNTRKALKNFIENKATSKGFSDVKMLNNETQVSRILSEGVSKKESADAVQQLLNLGFRGGAGGLIGTYAGPFDSSKFEGRIGNFLLGAAVGQATNSTYLKSNMASFINSLGKKEISVLDKYIQSKGKEKLSKEVLNKLTNFLSPSIKINSKGAIGNVKTSIIGKSPKEVSEMFSKKTISDEELIRNDLSKKLLGDLNKDSVNRQIINKPKPLKKK